MEIFLFLATLALCCFRSILRDVINHKVIRHNHGYRSCLINVWNSLTNITINMFITSLCAYT